MILSSQAGAGRKRILVDDEEDVSFFLSTALEDAGFQVETAASVDEALDKIKAAAPDCVSLDMMMPEKSGIVLYHELHKNHEWRTGSLLRKRLSGRR